MHKKLMTLSRDQLEAYAQRLHARGADDPNALDELCSVYWRLKRHEQAVEAFQLLLKHEPERTVDSDFDELYCEALRVTGSCPTPVARRYRLFNLVKLLQDTAKVGGDVVECGCFLGLSSYMMCSYLKRQNLRFDGHGYHIFDSFQGLSQPTADDDISDELENAETLRVMTQQGAFRASLERVKTNLSAFPGITFHPGWIPITFKGLPEGVYRFVHVDVDLYDPTLDSFNYFYPRLSPGGTIVSDDYTWPGARTAVNEFCNERDLTLLVNTVGQAYLHRNL